MWGIANLISKQLAYNHDSQYQWPVVASAHNKVYRYRNTAAEAGPNDSYHSYLIHLAEILLRIETDAKTIEDANASLTNNDLESIKTNYDGKYLNILRVADLIRDLKHAADKEDINATRESIAKVMTALTAVELGVTIRQFPTFKPVLALPQPDATYSTAQALSNLRIVKQPNESSGLAREPQAGSEGERKVEQKGQEADKIGGKPKEGDHDDRWKGEADPDTLEYLKIKALW